LFLPFLYSGIPAIELWNRREIIFRLPFQQLQMNCKTRVRQLWTHGRENEIKQNTSGGFENGRLN
jgi:hypothetical protein